ncbi:unnamed protein product [Callosobruchus maculatus]|uniref:Myb-like domain-containing protein n=1 Tax=Callosobruchus maculatus TaxID=64391 RepID=A0A653D1I6_CALMS|nr:unnamed protein product [Callosobruchus maculatus]
MSEDYENHYDGKCGICGVVGYLQDIQEHVLAEHEHVEENGTVNNSSPQQLQNTTEWQEGETRLLLDKYESYLPLVGPMKKFKTKKNMWLQISKDLSVILNVERSPLQCENRYKTILKRKKRQLKTMTEVAAAVLILSMSRK